MCKMMPFSPKTPYFCVKIRFIWQRQAHLASSLPIDFFYFESLEVPFYGLFSGKKLNKSKDGKENGCANE